MPSSIIRYVSRVNWSNAWNGVAFSPTPWCSSYRKGRLQVTFDYGHQLYFWLFILLLFSLSPFLYLFIRISIHFCFLVWCSFFVKWHVNLRGLFNSKAILLKEQMWYYLIHRWEGKVVHTFPNGPIVNIVAWREFEFPDNNIVV